MSINSAIDFFKKKRGWSEIKDNLLSWYLTPYLAKIFKATKHFYLIDGFSGPGLFEDGKKGSPLYEKDLLVRAYQSTSNKDINFKLLCVEKNKKLFSRLAQNMQGYDWIECFNNNIETILPSIISRAEKNSAIFIYLDPFGINGLPDNLDALTKHRKDLKIEILLNFSSAGCYRECCRLLGSKEFDDFFIQNSYIADDNRSIERMNKLLGTKGWHECIKWKNPEYQLSVLLCKKIKNGFKYVLNMPVRNVNRDEIKYRMIHCTNYSDGALLMADNMLSKSSSLKYSLFQTDLEGNIVDVDIILPKIMNYIPVATSKPIRLNELIMSFYEEVGVVCQSKQIIEFLKKKELSGDLVVTRIPDISPTGKLTSFWSESNKQIVNISKKILL